MKKFTLLLVVTFFAFSCSNEPFALSTESVVGTNSASSAKTASTAKSASTASTSNFSDYTIAVTVSPDGSEWTYLITKVKTNAKTLSHFIISLDNCGENSATFSDVISASVNAIPTDLSTIEGSGTGCNPQATTTNFIKFPEFSAASSWTLVIKFDRGYEILQTGTAWLKAGSSCNQGVVPAPGCPKEDRCSFSQGFFFANGAVNNGASALWANGLIIGGFNYTQAQGQLAWTTNNGKGKDTTLNAFFQLGAVRLSGAESEVAADAAVIDAYFGAISTNVFGTIVNGDFVLPNFSGGYTKDQVKAAGSAIGTYIEANHCL
ncbi:MAG: hypothetical protein H7Y10_07065 [Flavobacterium sp.]|nr:hypothetical protein [Flavobacterium sp.]